MNNLLEKYIAEGATQQIRQMAIEAASEIKALEVENDTLRTQIDDLTEQVTKLEADNLELAKAINSVAEDYHLARIRLHVWGR